MPGGTHGPATHFPESEILALGWVSPGNSRDARGHLKCQRCNYWPERTPEGADPRSNLALRARGAEGESQGICRSQEALPLQIVTTLNPKQSIKVMDLSK